MGQKLEKSRKMADAMRRELYRMVLSESLAYGVDSKVADKIMNDMVSVAVLKPKAPEEIKTKRDRFLAKKFGRTSLEIRKTIDSCLSGVLLPGDDGGELGAVTLVWMIVYKMFGEPLSEFQSAEALALLVLHKSNFYETGVLEEEWEDYLEKAILDYEYRLLTKVEMQNVLEKLTRYGCIKKQEGKLYLKERIAVVF